MQSHRQVAYARVYIYVYTTRTCHHNCCNIKFIKIACIYCLLVAGWSICAIQYKIKRNFFPTMSSLSMVASIILCPACGKEEDEDNNLKACTACKMVKYCNRDCQIAHRCQHKKECKKRAAELHEEALFKQPPPNEDCPVCFLPLPPIGERSYQSCCGKTLCNGCMDAVYDRTPSNKIPVCPFCRTPTCTSKRRL